MNQPSEPKSAPINPLRQFVQKHPALKPFAFGALTQLYRVRTWWSWLFRNQLVTTYLGSHAERSLQIGCGANIQAGWFNTDLQVGAAGAVFMDATKSFPFPNGSFDRVYSEHMIEHIPFEQGKFMLREVFRVLKPGGRIRIATPDLKVFAGLVTDSPSPDQQRFTQWFVSRNLPSVAGAGPSHAVNHFFYSWGHRFIYDRSTLEQQFREAGFTDLQWCAVGESADLKLRNLERHGAIVGSEEWNAFETIILEASKP